MDYNSSQIEAKIQSIESEIDLAKSIIKSRHENGVRAESEEKLVKLLYKELQNEKQKLTHFYKPFACLGKLIAEKAAKDK